MNKDDKNVSFHKIVMIRNSLIYLQSIELNELLDIDDPIYLKLFESVVLSTLNQRVYIDIVNINI